MQVRPENIPHGFAVLRCECCKNDIGLFKPQDLKVPLVATMFSSVGPGFPHPFRFLPQYPGTMTWEAARCPCCDRRPFNSRDHVFTPKGLFKVGDTLIPHRETQEERNQKTIEEEWARAEEDSKTPEERNQEEIMRTFNDTGEVVNLSDVRAQSEGKIFRYQKMEIIPGPTKFICPACGKEYSHASGLSRHKATCRKSRKGKR